VERNRVKRLLREAFDRECVRLPPGADAVIIARSGARELAERDGLRAIQGALSALLDKVEGAAPALEAGAVAEGDSGHAVSDPAQA